MRLNLCDIAYFWPNVSELPTNALGVDHRRAAIGGVALLVLRLELGGKRTCTLRPRSVTLR